MEYGFYRKAPKKAADSRHKSHSHRQFQSYSVIEIWKIFFKELRNFSSPDLLKLIFGIFEAPN